MANTNSATCPGCSGRMLVANDKTGNPVVCPLCEGTGTYAAYKPETRHYVVNAVLAAAAAPPVPGAGLQAQLNIDAQADFQLIWLTCTSTGGAFQSEISDYTGRKWDNAPVNDQNRFGTAQRPFPVGLSPVIMKAQSQFIINLADISGNPNTVQMAFIGYDLYPLKPASGS